MEQPDARPERRFGRGGLFGSTVVVTVFTLASQAVSFALLVVTAALFGASPEMDAFLAASTLPQYVVTVLLGAIGVVFMPIFMDYQAAHRDDEAWQVASGVITLSVIVLACITAAGMAFTRPLLQLTTPGLTSASLALASRLALITWLIVIPNGVLGLLTGIYQAQGRFAWPAAVPVVGGLVNVAVLGLLAHWLGPTSLAIAATSAAVLQAALVLPLALKGRRYRPTVQWRHPGVQQFVHLLIPLVLSSIFIRWTPVIDRYLASQLSPGSISRIGYAFALVTVVSRLMATGISTVIFPRMAWNAAAGDMSALWRTMSTGLRTMWLGVAPVMALGWVLAHPGVMVVFARGQFSAADGVVVTTLVRVYLTALIGMCLGTITGRGFYALKDTRTPAVVGVLEAIAYAIYTALLARRFGAVGVAWGYVIYFSVAITWHVCVLRYKTRARGEVREIVSALRILAAALAAGLSAWVAVQVVHGNVAQLFAGGLTGLVVYAIVVHQLGSQETAILLAGVSRWLKRP